MAEDLKFDIGEDEEKPSVFDKPINIENADKAIPSSKVVAERSEKAHFALGDKSPGVESLRNSIATGDENIARDIAAKRVALARNEMKMGMIKRLTEEKAAAGEPVTPEEMDFVYGLSQEELANPKTIFETEYAKRFASELAIAKNREQALFPSALKKDEAKTLDKLDAASNIAARTEIVRTKLQDVESRLKEQSWISTGLDFLETVIPFKSNMNLADENIIQALGVPGNNLEDQVRNLWFITDPDKFEAEVDSRYKRILETNPLDAQKFLSAMISYSTNDARIDNIFNVLNVADVGALAAGGLRLARGAAKGGAKTLPEQVSKAVADNLKALNAPDGVKPERVYTAMGDIDKAATLKAVFRHQLENGEDVTKAADRMRVVFSTVPSLIKPVQITDTINTLSAEAGARINSQLEHQAVTLAKALTDPAQGERLTEQALNTAIEEAKAKIRQEFNRASDSVIDVVRNARDVTTNTDSVSIRLGKTDATTFDNTDEAELFAKDFYQLRPGDYTIEGEGANIFIDVRRAIDESKGTVQDQMVTATNATPRGNSFVETFLGWLRTPAETTSELQKANRTLTSTASESSFNFIKEVAKSLGTITKKERKDFEQILRINRDMDSPIDGERGYFYQNVSELEQAYAKHIGRNPSEKEVAAYFSYVQLSDFDWVVRNLTMLRDKERLGLKQFSFEIGHGRYFDEYSPLVMDRTPSFEGKEVEYIPWNDEHLSILVVDPRTKTNRVVTRSSATAEVRAEIDALVKDQGNKIVQVASPMTRPFAELTGTKQPIQYVINKSFTKEELNPKQLGYRPGGHVEYAHNNWVKQAKVYTGEGGTKFYEGDVTLFNFSSQAQANKFAKRMEEARQLLKAGDDNALAAYLPRNLPYTIDELKALFNKDNGYLDIDQKFDVVKSGQRVADVRDFKREYGNFKDYTKGDVTLTDEVDRKFAGARDKQLRTIEERGTDENPLFNFKQAELIDPTPTLARSLGQATRSKYFGDLKISTANQFVTEFSGVMTESLEELRKYPLYYLKNPPWNESANAADLAVAKYTRDNAMRFLGESTPLSSKLEWVSSKLMDMVYNKGGQRTADWLSNSALMQSRDPIAFFRATAFHMKLGLFNPAQLFVQMQGIVHMAAIAGIGDVYKASTGGTLMRRLMINQNPEVIEGAANIAERMGWNKQHFKEAWDTLQRSGFNNVGRESTMLDDMSDPTLYNSTLGSFLDKGTFFFTEGERFVRMSAWNAAFLEWRAKNATRVIDNRAIGEIMVRADTLSVNMTRASKSSFETGIFSIPTQFASYNIRLFEQMTGKQLTRVEKLKLFTTYSAMYGVPVGVGTATGYPFYEDIKRKAFEYGYNPSDKFMTALIEGLPAMGISMVTGKDVNYAQRYGPGGIGIIKDLFDDEKTFGEILLGVSGSAVGDIVGSTMPVYRGLAEVMKSDGAYEPLVSDLVAAARSISSVNSLGKIIIAYNYNKNISKNGTYLSDMNTMEAIFSGVTGLSLRDVPDAFLKIDSMKGLKEVQDAAEKEYIKFMQRALLEGSNGNQKAMNSYLTMARAALIAGDFREDQKAALFGKAIKPNIALVEKINQDWFRRAPASAQQERMDQFINNGRKLEGTK